MKKWAHELNREFSKEELQMTSKYMKKCSSSLVIKEMQIKTALRFHLTLVRMSIIKSSNNEQMLPRMWENRNPYTLLVGMQISTNSMESSMEIPQKNQR
jgi:hypothetical protein